MTQEELRWMQIGKAMERACQELPVGTDLHIELENGAGTVRLYLPPRDGLDCIALDDWQDDSFADQINSAVDAAIEVANAPHGEILSDIGFMLAQAAAMKDEDQDYSAIVRGKYYQSENIRTVSSMPSQGQGAGEAPLNAGMREDPFEAADRAIGFAYPGERGMWGAQRIPNFGILRGAIAGEVMKASATSTQTEPKHSDDIAIDLFAAVMKAKMAHSRAKGRNGWDNPDLCPVERLQRMLVEHIPKGDPVDIGNFAMMLYHRGAPVLPLEAIPNEPDN